MKNMSFDLDEKLKKAREHYETRKLRRPSQIWFSDNKLFNVHASKKEKGAIPIHTWLS